MGSREIQLLERQNKLLEEQIQVSRLLQYSMSILTTAIPELATALGQDQNLKELKAKEDEKKSIIMKAAEKALEEERLKQ